MYPVFLGTLKCISETYNGAFEVKSSFEEFFITHLKKKSNFPRKKNLNLLLYLGYFFSLAVQIRVFVLFISKNINLNKHHEV